MCGKYLHVVEDFQKREGHSASNDHFIHFIKQVLNQQDLISNFGSVQRKLHILNNDTSIIIIIIKLIFEHILQYEYTHTNIFLQPTDKALPTYLELQSLLQFTVVPRLK